MNAHEFLTTVTIILAVMALIGLVELIVPLFTRPSSGRSTANLGLTVLTLSFNWMLNGAAAIIAAAFALQGPGYITRLGVPIGVQLVAGVAVLDFSFGYLAHRALHVSPMLWRVHRVHHCDPFVDVTTTYRNHPIEGLWRFLFIVIPVWLLGMPPEVVVIHRLLSALNGILEHANLRVWQPLDRILSLFWVTPHMHKVHHSRDQVETDSNYGNVLSVYDRVLGTFTPTKQALAVVYGLDDVDPVRSTSLPRLLAMPFHDVEVAAHEPTTISAEHA